MNMTKDKAISALDAIELCLNPAMAFLCREVKRYIESASNADAVMEFSETAPVVLHSRVDMMRRPFFTDIIDIALTDWDNLSDTEKNAWICAYQFVRTGVMP